MSSPFNDIDNRTKLSVVMDKLSATMDELESLRRHVEEWIDVEESSSCKCVLEELGQIDASLYSLHQTIHVYGSQISQNVQKIDNHEANLMTVRLSHSTEASEGEFHH